MEKTIDYYEILSVSRNADLSIIKSAYRTLANKYHPDKCEDNLKENAEEKIRLINEAYEVLSDPIKKSEYDQKIKNSKNEQFSSSFGNDSEWQTAIKYYPRIRTNFEDLAALSFDLANSFREYIFEKKDFENTDKIKEDFEKKYLSKLFTKDKDLYYFGKKLILSGNLDAANSLKNTISVLGNKVSYNSIKKQICEDFNLESILFHHPWKPHHFSAIKSINGNGTHAVITDHMGREHTITTRDEAVSLNNRYRGKITNDGSGFLGIFLIFIFISFLYFVISGILKEIG